jgi:hypothetical protein
MESRCQDKFGKIFRQGLQAQKNVLAIKNEDSYTFCEFYHFKYNYTISEKLAQWVQSQ